VEFTANGSIDGLYGRIIDTEDYLLRNVPNIRAVNCPPSSEIQIYQLLQDQTGLHFAITKSRKSMALGIDTVFLDLVIAIETISILQFELLPYIPLSI
jgi:hypothetical protein